MIGKLLQSRSVFQRLALWQMPLMLVLSLEIGWFLWLFWAASWAVSSIQRWWLQLPVLSAFIYGATLVVPVKTADFFILLLITLLPFTWRLDQGKAAPKEEVSLSPAGLCPTIFLVGSVFIYQVQFIILLGLVAWLLAFLLWYTTALTGFRLETLTIRWLPIITGSFVIAAVIVGLFSVIPRINSGFVPGFETADRDIGLTDELRPGGMANLLQSNDVAFRAIPLMEGQGAPDYWRVYSLTSLTGDQWRRVPDSRIRPDFTAASDSVLAQFDIVPDTHDMDVLPMPGWAGDAAFASSHGYGFNQYGEALLQSGQNPQKVTIQGRLSSSHDYTYPASLALGDANPELVAYGVALREAFPNEDAFIDEIMRQFRDEFSYSTTVSYPDEDALDAFFFTQKSGYCSYFATAMATLLRAGGVPAHVGVGYLGGDWNQYGSFWLVSQSDAHAWVEYQREDGSWHRLDPTLQVMRLSGERFQGQVEFGRQSFAGRTLEPETKEPDIWDRARQIYQYADSLNLRITLAIMNYGDDDTADNASASNADNFALLLAIIGIGVTILFVMALAWRLARAQKQVRPREERALEAALQPLCGPREEGVSLLRYTMRLAPYSGSLAQQAYHYASLIYQHRFSAAEGESTLPQKQDMAALRKAVRQLKAQTAS